MIQPRRVAILGGNRTPFARAHKEYAKASNQDLLTAALDGLVARYGLAGERLGEVAGGAVMKHSRDFNLTRDAVLNTALDPHTPACDLQQACATGVQAVNYISNKIALGQIDSGIAGGSETASDAPIAVSEELRSILLQLKRTKTWQEKAKVLAQARPQHLAPLLPGVDDPRTGLSMGGSQAITTERWGITREAQDETAFHSHQNMAKAWDEGFFDDLVTPYLGVTKDTVLRPGTSLEKLASLKPVFGGENGTMTAGNSTALTDGASAVLLSSEEWAQQHGLKPLAYFVDSEVAAVDYVSGEEGLLMAPTYAIARILQRNGLRLQDFDLYEIHEAFASTVLCHLAALESADFCKEKLGLDAPLGSIDRSKLNTMGGSLAAGHPFAATGGRIIATIAKQLHARGGGRALVSVCAAGGLGTVAIVEA